MSDFAALKQRVDIVDFISSETGYSTKRVGRLIDLKECPFCHGHNCFRMDADKNKWTCYQCSDTNSPHSANGDIFDFIQKHRDCNTKKVQLKSASLYQQNQFASPFASTKSGSKEKGNADITIELSILKIKVHLRFFFLTNSVCILEI